MESWVMNDYLNVPLTEEVTVSMHAVHALQAERLHVMRAGAA